MIKKMKSATDGKKTYIVSGLTILGAVCSAALKFISSDGVAPDVSDEINLIYIAVTAMTIRSGMKKIGAPETI